MTSLESSYARIIRDDTAELTTNVAETHSDVLQAAYLLILILKGVTERPSSTAQEQEPFHRPLKQLAPCQTPERTPMGHSTWLARPLAIGRALAGQWAAKASFMPVFKLNCTCLLVVLARAVFSSDACRGAQHRRCPQWVLPGSGSQVSSGLCSIRCQLVQHMPLSSGSGHCPGPGPAAARETTRKNVTARAIRRPESCYPRRKQARVAEPTAQL